MCVIFMQIFMQEDYIYDKYGEISMSIASILKYKDIIYS